MAGHSVPYTDVVPAVSTTGIAEPMRKPKTKPTAIGILGMHRSGTSSVARVVNVLGAYVGEDRDLMQPTPDNPEGYWEYQQIFVIHERILTTLQRTWDTALHLPTDWHLSEELAPHRDELIELVQTQFGKKAVWAWKDPRTSILLPLWKDILAKLEIELQCLLVFRNPLDVARSLETRDGFSRDAGFSLWLNHNLAMLTSSIGLRRALVSYTGLLADPIANVSRWAAELPLQWSPGNETLQNKLRQAVRTELCHSKSTLEELRRSGCPAPVLKLARMLHTMEKKGNLESPESIHQIGRINDSHVNSSKLYSHDFIRVKKKNHELKTKRDSLEKQLAEARTLMEDQNRWLLERASLISKLRHELQDRESQLGKLESQLTEKGRALAEHDSRLDAAENSRLEFKANFKEAQSQLAEKEQSLAERDSLLKAAKTSTRRLEAEIAEMRSKLAEKDQAIAELNSLLKTAESSNLEYAAELDNARLKLAKKDEMLTERNKLLNNVHAKMEDQETQLHETQERLTTRKGEVANLQQSMDRLKATYSWRITRPLRKVLDYFTSAVRRIRDFAAK